MTRRWISLSVFVIAGSVMVISWSVVVALLNMSANLCKKLCGCLGKNHGMGIKLEVAYV